MRKNHPSRAWNTCVVMLLLAGASAAIADPPRVVRSVPDNGGTDVDPFLRELLVEFDQDMDTGGFSWCGGGENFPKMRGRPRWVSARICAVAVDLEPNKEYAYSINCPAAQNFRNRDGEPAEIYPISFRTGNARAGERDIRNVTRSENARAVQDLRQAIDASYSYRDLRKLDWSKLFGEYGPKMESAESTGEFVKHAAQMLAKAEDIHIFLEVGGSTYPTHRRSVPPNCNFATLRKAVPEWKKRNDIIATGRFEDGIGYVMIASWEAKHAAALDAAFEALDDIANAPGLVIDVRVNAGGDEGLAQKFAGCFVDEPVVYAKQVYRKPDTPADFTEPVDRVLNPTKARPKYRGKVAVLMGRHNMSSCEGFLLMMRAVPKCKLVGEQSYGASGNPKPHGLANGVTVYLPSWKSMTADGREFEGTGLTPDVEVRTSAKDFESTDPVLDAALRGLRGT